MELSSVGASGASFQATAFMGGDRTLAKDGQSRTGDGTQLVECVRSDST